jgi:hypothetical protein
MNAAVACTVAQLLSKGDLAPMTDHRTAHELCRLAQLSRLQDATTILGPRALEILVRQAERLADGVRAYAGDDFTRQRPYRMQAAPEELDCRNYLLADMLDAEGWTPEREAARIGVPRPRAPLSPEPCLPTK